MNILWLPLAQDDINEIYDFYASKSIVVATNIYNEILDSIDKLALFPEIASVEQVLSEFIITYRSLVVCDGLYKVIYFIKGNSVFISAIWDCRSNPDNYHI